MVLSVGAVYDFLISVWLKSILAIKGGGLMFSKI